MRLYGGSGPPNRSEILGELAAGARAAWPKGKGGTSPKQGADTSILYRRYSTDTASYLTVPYLTHGTLLPYYLHSSYLNVDTFLIRS